MRNFNSFLYLPEATLWLQKTIENCNRKFVDLPVKIIVIFQFANCKRLPEGNSQ